MYKALIFAFLAATAQAVSYDGHQATSFIKYNDNHNAVHHIHSAPAIIKAAPVHYAAPVHQAAPVAHYAAPVAHYAAPVSHYASHAAPAHHGASSFASFNAHSAGHVATPHYTSAHYAAPVAQYAAPVAHYAAPVAKVVAPVAKVVAPVAYAHAPAYHHEEYAHPKYEFAYGVEDHHTGDIHSHKEARDGDVTHGEYSLHEADGTVRTVKYSVDKHSGFNAVVERSGHANHAQPAKAIYAPVKAIVADPHHHYHH